MKHTALALLLLGLTAALRAAPPTAPATQPTKPAPADATLDWLMKQPAPAVSAGNTPPPDASSAEDQKKNKEQELGIRLGTLITSDGEKFHAKFSTTLDKPIRLWDEQKKEYRDIPFVLIKSMDAKIIWERDEREWHFRESGSDIKEYSGKTYPAREMQYTVTLANGQSVTGGIASPIYMEMPHGDPKVFILHKRDKGEPGQTLKQLVYVTHLEFEEGKAVGSRR